MDSLESGGSGRWEMKILDNLFGPQTRNLNRALDRTSERFGVLSGNMANANVAGYKRRDVDFGIELEQAGRKFQPGGFDQSGTHVSEGSVRTDGSSVNMETEAVAIAETEIRYQLLTDMTSRYFSGLKSVIREGR